MASRFGKLWVWRVLLGLGLVALFAGHAAQWYRLPLLPRLESMLYDLRVRALAPRTLDERIVVVDIDEKSLLEKDRGGEGRWPWPRDRLARLVTLLLEQQASLVALDLILSEKDQSSGLAVLEALAKDELKADAQFKQALEKWRPRLSFDQLFAQSMQAGPVVLGFAFHNGMAAVDTRLPEGVAAADWGLSALRAQSYPGYTGMLPEFVNAAAGAGHLNPLVDEDGVRRRVPLLIEHQGRYYPALSLAVLQAFTGVSELGLSRSTYGSNAEPRVESISVGPIEIPVDDALNALVPFRGAQGSFPYYSALDVLQGRLPADALKNRIVLIGTSASGLADLVATPFGVSFPGVEVHANLISGMLDARVLHRPAYTQGLELLTVLLLGCLLVFGGLWRKARYTIGVGVLALVALLATSSALLWQQQLLVPLATPLACLLSLFAYQMAYGFFVQSRGMRQISDLFGYYVPPELVEKMAENPGAFTMVPVQRELTVLFADVRGFTSISEGLSPHDLSDLINTYLTAMSEVIREANQGTLDKYIGDAVMAFWGAPVEDPRHAQNAVRAALGMQAQARRLSQQFVKKGWPELRIGIGLNSGPMRVGDMGSKIRRAYTVMGDAVNLGARLEGLTKHYGVGILIGEETQKRLPGWACREVDRVRVKGKNRPVAIFEPLGPDAELPETLAAELAQWQQVLLAYRAQDWGAAQLLLASLQVLQPLSELYALYAKRIAHFQAHPPMAQWDGATNHESK